MDLKILVVFIGLRLALVECLDFSQFYLPQCCYIPPIPTPVAASTNTPAYRSHDIKTRRAEPPVVISKSEVTLPAASSPNNTTATGASSRKKKIGARLFRYIIPYKTEEKEISSNEASEDTSDSKYPQTFAEIRANRRKMRKSFPRDQLNAHVDKLLSSAQIEKELEVPQNASKPLDVEIEKSNTTESSTKTKRMANGNSFKNSQRNQSSSHSSKMSRVPADWMINLRRALYQSIDTMIANNVKRAATEETLEMKSSRYNPNARSSNEETNHISELWRHLRKANFSMIEPIRRSASTIPQDVFLPNAEGPVASGVVVNTVDGIQLRMASELYFQQDDPNSIQNPGGCNCHLINNGDILMAYWTVSRIVNEDGKPALQYLIYPLPHNVPTPPRMISFNSQPFGPSLPYDPHANKGSLTKQPGQPGHSHVNHASSYQTPYTMEQQLYEDSPGHLEDISMIEHHISPEKPPTYAPKYDEALKNLQIFNQLPVPAPPVDNRQGYRGVLIHNQHGYTPEFLELYKQAVVNHLNHKDPYDSSVISSPPTGQVYSPKPVPPAHLQLFDGKAGLDFPKSIQDILSPIPGTPFIAAPVSPSQHSDLIGPASFESDFHAKLPPPTTAEPNYHDAVNYGHNPMHYEQDSPLALPPGFKLGNVYRFDHQKDFSGNYPPIPPDQYQSQPPLPPFHHASDPHPFPQHDHHPDDKRYDPKPYYDRNPPPLPPRRHPGSYEDDIRYHRSQPTTTRHRSEKYGRPNDKLPDGSYIINF